MSLEFVRNKVKQHGYWRVLIRPSTFRTERIANILELEPILDRLSVRLRGWDFPHIDHRNQVTVGKSWIEQDTDWEMYVESWRFYQTGQFIHYDGFKEDWLHQARQLGRSQDFEPGEKLAVVSALFRFTEVFEFAKRFAFSEVGDPSVHVEIGLSGLQNRTLWLDSETRAPFFRDYTAAIPEFKQSGEHSQEELAAESRSLSRRYAQELFRRFGWDPSIDALRSMQDELDRFTRIGQTP